MHRSHRYAALLSFAFLLAPLRVEGQGRIEAHAPIHAFRVPVARQVRATQRAMPGVRRRHGVTTGRTIEMESVALPRGEAIEARLTEMARIELGADPEDFVFYADAEVITPTAEAVLTSFSLDAVEFRPRERARLEALAERIAAEASRIGLEVYSLQAGWGDAVGSSYHGVFVREAGEDRGSWIGFVEVWGDC